MEATVCSCRDATNTRRVVLSSEPLTPPTCCVYSMVGDSFPCWHGTAVLCEKYGSVNLHQFIAERNLSIRWKEQYDGTSFKLLCQADVDKVLLDAQDAIARGECMNVPVALAPPRGRPLKNAGKRLRSWYEHGPSTSRRTYTCSLCHLRGHTARTCELRQMFPDT